MYFTTVIKVMSYLLSITPFVQSTVNYPYHIELIETFSSAFNNKFVIIIKNGSDTGGSTINLINLQKVFSRSLKLYTSVLDVEALKNLITGEEKNFGKTTVYVQTEWTVIKDLAPLLVKEGITTLTWLCEISSEEMAKNFDEMFIPFDSKFFLFLWTGKKKARLLELYQISRDSRMRVNHFGEWDPEKGLRLQEKDLTERRKDLNGIVLRYVIHRPLDEYHPCSTRTVSEYALGMFECFNFLLWNEFEKTFNFKTKYLPLSCDTDKTSTLLKKLQNREGDVGIFSLILTSKRKSENRFLSPIFHSGIFFLSGVSYGEIGFSSFIKPFSVEFWIVLLIWLLSFGAILALLYYAVDRITSSDKPGDYSYIFFVPFYLIFMQGYDLEVNSSAIRIVIIMILIVPVFISTAYSGDIISSLAIPQKIPFRNVKEFVGDGTYKLIVINDTYYEKMLQDEPEFEVFRKYSLISKEMPGDYRAAFSNICTKKTTLMTGLPALTPERPKCNTHIMDENLGKYFASMAVAPDFPFTELLNRFLLKRIMSGIRDKSLEKAALDYFQLKMKFSKTRKSPYENSDGHFNTFEPVGPANLIFLFGILVAGVIISLFVLFLELFGAKILRNLNC